MYWRFDGYNHVVRLKKGELLMRQLTAFVREQKISGAWLSGVGAAAWAELGFYDLAAKDYQWKKLNRPLEITTLQGNVAWEGTEPILHIHAALSDEHMQVYGGHVKELEVTGTCEILLHRWYEGQLTRSLDPDTGLRLLDL